MTRVYICYAVIILCSVVIGVFLASHCELAISKVVVRDKLTDDYKPTARYKRIQKIIVVFLNVVLWVVLFLLFEEITWNYLLYCLVSSSLLGLSVVDLAVYEIPIEFNIVIIICALCHMALDFRDWLLYLIGFFTVSGIFFIISVITKGRGMGGGDIKLMATLGLMLGWQKILLVMTIGALLGAVIHGIRMAVTKKEHMLAFGPYLAIAGFIVICYGDRVIDWYISNFLTFNY